MARMEVGESQKPSGFDSFSTSRRASLLRLLAAPCLLLVCAGSHSQSTPAEMPEHVWKASWITSPDAPHREECVLHFRKEVDLASQPDRFAIYVSADNQYLLKVNGKFAGTGPSHGDIQHWKYTAYDIDRKSVV